MLLLFLLIFVVLPIVELTLLFQLGNWLGWIPTLALVFGAGLAGAALARFQGFQSAMRVRSQLVHGVLPAAEMFDGVLSDVLGLALLIPPVRTLVRQWLMHIVRTRFRVQLLGDRPGGGRPHEDRLPRRGDEIIDARVIETRVVD
jgi:UPF0716 protein FxsA